MNRFSKIKSAIVMLILMLTLCVPVAAAGNGVITVNYKLSGVDFELYKAGTLDRRGNPVLTGDFSKYSITLDSNNAAATLAAYVERDGIKPLKTGTTNEFGTVIFSGLDDGVYLVVGEQKNVAADDIDIPVPVLVTLPYNDADVTDSREVIVVPKHRHRRTPPEGNSSYKITVNKMWAGDEVEDRPDSVKIQLLRDGKVYDTVELNEGNSWRHVWTIDIADYAKWSVLEETVPKGYTVDVEMTEGWNYIFGVTNTKEELPPDDDDGGKDIPEGAQPDQPDQPDTPDGPSPEKGVTDENIPDENTNVPENTPEDITPDEPSIERLPQTGQLWWPVPIFAGIGLVLILIGIKLGGRNVENEK